MRARRMVFTVPAGFRTASLSEPVHGSAAGLEAVDSLADGALTADSADGDLTVDSADAASAVAEQ